MNKFTGTLLLSLAVLLAGNVYADTTKTTTDESSAKTESTPAAESSEATSPKDTDESADALLKKKEEAEDSSESEATTEESASAEESKMEGHEGHADKAMDEEKPAEEINYDEEEEPNEDSCD